MLAPLSEPDSGGGYEGDRWVSKYSEIRVLYRHPTCKTTSMQLVMNLPGAAELVEEVKELEPSQDTQDHEQE